MIDVTARPSKRLSRAWLLGLLLPLPGAIAVGGVYSVAIFVKIGWLVGITSVRRVRVPRVLIGLLVLIALSWFWSVTWHPAARLQSTIGLARWLFDFSFFIIGANLLNRHASVSELGRGARLGLLLAAAYLAYAMFQLGYLPGRLPDLAWGEAKRALREWVKDWPNYYGVFLACLICIFQLQTRPVERLFRRPVVVFCCFIALCSVSRSVFLLLALFVFWELLVRSPRPIVFVRNVLIAGLAFFLLLQAPLLRDRIVNQTLRIDTLGRATGAADGLDKDVIGRFERWAEAWPYIAASPVLGYGQRSLSHLSEYVYSDFYGQAVETGSVHNDFIDMALRSGIPSVAWFVYFILHTAWRARRSSLLVGPDAADTLRAFADTSFLMLVIGMTGDFYRYEAWISLYWLLAGGAYGLAWRAAEDAAPAAPVQT